MRLKQGTICWYDGLTQVKIAKWWTDNIAYGPEKPTTVCTVRVIADYSTVHYAPERKIIIDPPDCYKLIEHCPENYRIIIKKFFEGAK
jgi:hypothetical protein